MLSHPWETQASLQRLEIFSWKLSKLKATHSCLSIKSWKNGQEMKDSFTS